MIKKKKQIADFGLAHLYNDNNVSDGSEGPVTMATTVGTVGYRAPEILLKIPYTNACDIFAAGVVLFILLAGCYVLFVVFFFLLFCLRVGAI